jgi:hypothetical protein
MQVTNDASFPVIAFCFHSDVGYGNDVTIEPGESAEVQGPYIGQMDGGDCHVIVEGSITCHEKPDDENGFQVLPDQQLHLANGVKGVTVRHYSDEVERQVQEWRMANT